MPICFSLRYATYVYSCQVKTEKRPLFVSLVGNSTDVPLNTLIIFSLTPQDQRHKFVHCSAPFHSQFSDLNLLMSAVEFAMSLGAEHFVFYKHTMQPSVEPYLQYLVEKGLATIKDWTLIPVSVSCNVNGRDQGSKPGDPQLQMFGQLAAFNDCLYYNLNRSLYIVNQDFDELIVPTEANSWSELMDALPPGHSAYTMRMAYFPLEQNNTGPYAEDKTAQKLPPLVKLMRDDKFLPSGIRSKYIADTRSVMIMGIHEIHGSLGKLRPMTVNPSVAKVHHYRRCCLDKHKMVPDHNVLRFVRPVLSQHKNATQRFLLG
jgi:hypothetical protein